MNPSDKLSEQSNNFSPFLYSAFSLDSFLSSYFFMNEWTFQNQNKVVKILFYKYPIKLYKNNVLMYHLLHLNTKYTHHLLSSTPKIERQGYSMRCKRSISHHRMSISFSIESQTDCKQVVCTHIFLFRANNIVKKGLFSSTQLLHHTILIFIIIKAEKQADFWFFGGWWWWCDDHDHHATMYVILYIYFS